MGVGLGMTSLNQSISWKVGLDFQNEDFNYKNGDVDQQRLLDKLNRPSGSGP